MPALELDTFGYSANVFPAPTGTGNSALKDLDRVLYEVLEFYAAVLGLQLGARWTEAATAAGLAAPANIVAYKTPYDPRDFFEEDAAPFPQLAVYRVTEKFSRKTDAWDQARVQLGVDWSMPPLTSAQMEQLAPFLQGVGKVLRYSTQHGSHAGYRGGENIWATTKLDSVEVSDAAYGNLVSQSNLVFPSVHLTLDLVEREMPVAGAFQALEGVDTGLDLKVNDGTTVPDVVELIVP